MRLSKEKLEAAIKTVESSRATHLDWAQFFEANPDAESRFSKTVHGALEQREIIRQYDNVISCLRESLLTVME